ncbi:MAG: molybdopterin molybdotransferase MoeA [Treponema sp.]|nr:molybdopterin molybdotransferase MoeA [Treponema sp.]
MKLLTVDTVAEARQKILGCVSGLKVPVERLEISRALGRVLAEDIEAPEDIPNFRRSTVDGYAVHSSDTSGAGESAPVFLKLAGKVEMGRSADFSLNRGECAYVPTGAMVPGGADAVVMVEYCETFDGEIALYESAAAGSHVAAAGEDARKGSVLLKKGVKIRSQETGALAAAGITEAPVFAPLRLAIISSGDELVAPSARPRPGEIRDVNSLALAALARESGYRVTGALAVKDDEGELEAAVREAMGKNDVVVLSGGSSQGAKDMTEKVLSRAADPGVFTHGLAIKPGKPTILAYDKVTGAILAGLPGHPVSALMVFRVLLSWLAGQLTFSREAPPVPAKITCNLASSPGRTVYQPVSLRFSDGNYLAEPVFGKSGMISTLTNADGYIVIDLNKEGLRAGEEVLVFLWGE